LQDIVWIDWESSCRRSRELCNYLQIEPIVLNSLLPGKLGLVELLFRTICVLFKTRPCVLAVASLRIALLAVLLKPIFRCSIIVDCHYSGIIPSPSIPAAFHTLYSFIYRHAYLVLVTNKPHADIVKSSGGKPFILQDRIPSPSFIDQVPDPPAKKQVVCICSYNIDEPVAEILNAAKLLQNTDISIYLTGDSRGKFFQNELPENVILTGYLSDEKYWQLLWESDLIVDLTKRDNCLVCGAYEAVAVGKPMLLSNSEAIQDYFTRGVVYTKNSGRDIAINIKKALDSADCLAYQVIELKSHLKLNWEPVGEIFKEEIKSICKLKKRLHQQKHPSISNI